MVDDLRVARASAGHGVTEQDHQFTRHRGPVTGVAAPSGRPWAITSAYDGAIAFFDLESREVRLVGYHDHLVNRVVCSPDGTRAASCSSDYTIRLWDLETLRCTRVLRGHSDDVEDFVFIDERTGASASRDHRILLWDLETGAIRSILEGHEKDVLSLAYHDGRLYSSGDDMTLRVWDVDSGALLTMWGPFEVETDTCAIDPIHGRVILGCDDGCVRVFEIDSGEPVRVIEAHASGIKKVAVSPANGDVLSAAYDQKVIIWDGESLESKMTVQKKTTTWERSLSFSPDGAKVLGGTFDGTVLVWNATSGKLEAEIGRQEETPGNACFNEVASTGDDGLVAVSDDGFVRWIRLAPGAAQLLSQVEPPSGRMLMNAVTAEPQLRRVACGTHDNKLQIFDLVDDRLEHTREVFLGEGPINTIRFSRHEGSDGDVFVGCYEHAIVRVSADGQIRDTLHVHDGAVKSLRLHPREPVGVSCGADGLLVSWRFDGEILNRFLGHTAIINDVDLDPTGRRLASVSRDFTLKVYDFDDGSLVETFPLGRRSLKSVCFADPDTVVVGDYWGAVVRVDLTDATVRRASIATNGISALARSGEHVAASSYDGGVYLLRPSDLSVVGAYRQMDQRLPLRAAS